jgi:hypothetical protein
MLVTVHDSLTSHAPGTLAMSYQAKNAQSPQILQAVAMHQYVHDTYIDPVGAVFNVKHWNASGTANHTTNMCEGLTLHHHHKLIRGENPSVGGEGRVKVLPCRSLHPSIGYASNLT